MKWFLLVLGFVGTSVLAADDKKNQDVYAVFCERAGYSELPKRLDNPPSEPLEAMFYINGKSVTYGERVYKAIGGFDLPKGNRGVGFVDEDNKYTLYIYSTHKSGLRVGISEMVEDRSGKFKNKLEFSQCEPLYTELR